MIIMFGSLESGACGNSNLLQSFHLVHLFNDIGPEKSCI